jgi:hypothetical protein
MEEEEGVYTQLEYSFFIDFLKALTAELQLAKASAKAAVGPDVVIPVLEMYVAVKLNNQELPLFNSECEILKRSVNRLWGQVKAGYNIPMTVKVQAGQELSDLLSGQGDGKTAVYNTLLRVQSEVDFVVEKCLDQKSEAY